MPALAPRPAAHHPAPVPIVPSPPCSSESAMSPPSVADDDAALRPRRAAAAAKRSYADLLDAEGSDEDLDDEPPARRRKTSRGNRKMSAEEVRLEKNRQSARDCRRRKKHYIQTLEAKVAQYDNVRAELEMTRAQLAELRENYNALLQKLR